MIKLVIADDEHITRLGLQSLDWEEEGFQIVGVAGSGLEALDLIRSCKPDLLLTDIRMPGMDGLSLMKVIQTEFPQIKVIFITAYHQLDYAMSAIKLGAAGFVLKPTDPDEIMDTCKKAKLHIEADRSRLSAEQQLRQQVKEYTLTLQEKMLPDTEVRSDVVNTVSTYLENHYMDEITISKLADQLHFHPDYLSRVFKKETGENFSDTLTRIRMHKAVELLADPAIRVYEISELVGIRDSRYFSQLFKKRYGVTPNEFRVRTLTTYKEI